MPTIPTKLTIHTKPKFAKESDAWEWCASAWYEASKDIHGRFCARGTEGCASSVCQLLVWMYGHNYIDQWMHNSMDARMMKYTPKLTGASWSSQSLFWWPRYKREGAIARAEFCVKMAEEARQEEKST